MQTYSILEGETPSLEYLIYHFVDDYLIPHLIMSFRLVGGIKGGGNYTRSGCGYIKIGKLYPIGYRKENN
jgi:hypothetical protein